MIFEEVNKDNIDIAIRIQNEIFPEESGAEDIRQSLNGGRNEIHAFKKYFLAKVDDNYVGISGIYSYIKYPNDAWLGWFGVLEGERRKGYATKIINHIMEEAKTLGFETLRLYTDEEDNKDAVKFYKKLGMISEVYDNPEDNHFEIGKTLIFSKSLSNAKDQMWYNKNLFLNAHDIENGIIKE